MTLTGDELLRGAERDSNPMRLKRPSCTITRGGREDHRERVRVEVPSVRRGGVEGERKETETKIL